MKNTSKPYPCGIVMHPVTDGAIQLSHQTHDKNSSLENVKSIELRGIPEVLVLTGKTSPPDRPRRQIQHLSRRSHRPLSWNWGRKVNVHVTTDEGVPTDAACVMLRYEDGTELEKHVEHAEGSMENPLTGAKLKEMFMGQVTLAIGTERAARACETFFRRSSWTI
ncbi:hypothetical protein P171DRAFT_481932 [Karstenula rhodostoma CBS 690.94]|uniref:Uncharacterized protein n=1 Tax=Karstenula rhodostoma CBS 690.94 TaxID=1392251 RepID=A0A9P4PTA8_9PLEO|nr:hypothetical protein P171DRAFT_481932 [Karstenula rhodostoma CBS 690.94]